MILHIIYFDYLLYSQKNISISKLPLILLLFYLKTFLIMLCALCDSTRGTGKIYVPDEQLRHGSAGTGNLVQNTLKSHFIQILACAKSHELEKPILAEVFSK